MSQIKVNTINDASGGNNAVLYGPACPDNSMGFRNRIINGDMRIDQRNAGASVTPNGAYTLDRWYATNTQTGKFSVQQDAGSVANGGSVVAPAGFTNWLGVTSLSSYSVLSTDIFVVRQAIEGLNVSDLGWGTANARPVTLSFWVCSSITGTFGGGIYNSAANRSYPFSYTINSANTWEYETITIPGDTTGTWLTNNGVGMYIGFNLGAGSNFLGTANTWGSSYYVAPTGATSVVGTNGATFYITGVQLEAGSVATPFERRPYGTELALCQRYYSMYVNGNTQTLGAAGLYDTTTIVVTIPHPVTMRVTPTIVQVNSSGYFQFAKGGGSLNVTNSFATDRPNPQVSSIFANCANSNAGYSGYCFSGNASAYFALSAEL